MEISVVTGEPTPGVLQNRPEDLDFDKHTTFCDVRTHNL